jgi:Pyruvate/2-oxoacid:ferredoxin oxidoreductase delta subunit
LVKVLGKLVWVRPKPDENRCKRCGACIAICPTRAMNPKDGFPVIDYNKCISCFCCDEVCPHNAIDQDLSWLTKLFR